MQYGKYLSIIDLDAEVRTSKMGFLAGPVAVNATFLLSGLLGLQLQIPDGNGHTRTVETSVPFNVKPNTTMMMLSPHKGDDGTGGGYGYNNDLGSCGERDCHSGEEMCITWAMQNEPSKEYRECMPIDGRFSTKSNPLSLKLCPSGQTHSLVLEAQPCLQSPNPCPIRWRYNCVPEQESPHICKLRQCPENFWCVQFIRCQRYPPCFTMAQCIHKSDLLN